MKKETIWLDDWQRILVGDAPVEFLLEVFIRTSFMYLVLLVIMRLLGKRMNGQLTNLELAVMLTMGAIMAPAMQIPDRGIVSGVLALLCALTFLKGMSLLGLKSSKTEKLIQGTETVLVKDGIIQLEQLASNQLSHQQIFAALRSENVYNLGQVKRLYLEAYGQFSIYENKHSKPGLSVLPPLDNEVRTIHEHTDDRQLACTNCGNTVPALPTPGPCAICRTDNWVNAIL